MDVDDVDLNTLSSRGSFLCAWCLLTVRLLRARSRIHIGRNDSLNVEELLVVLTRFRSLPALAHSVRLLLDILSRVRPAAVTTATLAASPAVGLGRRLVLALEHLLLRVQTTSILVHVRAAIAWVCGALLALPS